MNFLHFRSLTCPARRDYNFVTCILYLLLPVTVFPIFGTARYAAHTSPVHTFYYFATICCLFYLFCFDFFLNTTLYVTIGGSSPQSNILERHSQLDLRSTQTASKTHFLQRKHEVYFLTVGIPHKYEG